MTRRKSAGTRSRTSREELVGTAVSLVDREGIDALTIRRLAAECGVTPMAVYRHVRDKNELLDLVVEAVVSGLSDLKLRGSWRTKAITLFGEFRRLMLDHPGVATVFVGRPTPTPAVLHITDLALGIVHEAGFRGADAVRAFDALVVFTIGSLMWQLPRTDGERQQLVSLALRTTGEPSFVLEYAADLARRDPDEHFAYGLETILRGLEAGLGRGGRRPSRAGRA
jgi:AcrR family transcriptional regulator